MQKGKENGFIQIIVLVIIGLVAAKYFFDFNIFDFLASPDGKSLVSYLGDIFSWIKEAVLSLWVYLH